MNVFNFICLQSCTCKLASHIYDPYTYIWSYKLYHIHAVTVPTLLDVAERILLFLTSLNVVFLVSFSCFNLNSHNTFPNLGTPRSLLHTTSLILSHLVPNNCPLSTVSHNFILQPNG